MEQFSLQELNTTIKSVLKKGLASSYWVVAEISQLSVNATGHCYLELVQKQNECIIARSKATIWANTYKSLSLWFEKMAGGELKVGMKILCNATVQYHETFGMSLNIRDIDADFTIGEKTAKRQQIINQLAEEGVLTMNRELPLNSVLQNIAVISSPTAAGYEDFLNQLHNNPYNYYYHTDLYEATMQGNTSSEAIVEALQEIHQSNHRYDVVVIIRGGGSSTDLDSYDTYGIAAHIAQFPIPVFTGIGHERDESVADIVAHTSLKTPTAVAEYIINKSASYESMVTECLRSIHAIAKQFLIAHQQNLEHLNNTLTLASKSLILTNRHTLSSLSIQLQRVAQLQMYNQCQHLDLLQHSLEILSPENVLRRGYSMTTINGELIKENTIFQKGDPLITETFQHIIESTVIDKKSKP